MSASETFVRAVIVTAGRPGFLAETLAAIASQDRKVDAWHLVVIEGRRTAGKDLGIPPGLGIPVTRVSASTFGAAVSAVLRENPGQDEWLWFLHDDSAPAQSALRRLVATTAKRRRAGIVGPAQVAWDDPRTLVSVGTTVSASGRRLNSVDQDDLDQGQYEGREDVLAVGLAGALVWRGAWEKLGGTDPAYGFFGDSADFCRRAWRAGYDVIVVPKARVRHAQGSLVSRPDSAARRGRSRLTHAERRASEWYHGLAWARKGLVAPMVLWAVVSSLGRALARLGAGEPRMALADVRVPAILVSRLRHLSRSRRAVADSGMVPVERRLLASLRDVASQARTRELGAYEAWRAETRPSDVQRAEIASLRVRRRWALAAVAGVLIAISVALYGTWLAPLVRGDMLVGSAMGTSDVSVADLWDRTWTGWSDGGFGAPALDGSFAALMLPFAMVPGGLALGAGMLLALAPLFAGLAAWFAAGAATRSLTTRGVIAVAWGVWPSLTASVVDGRVGAVLAHILLPLLALTVVRAMAVQRRDRLGDGLEFPALRIGSPRAAAAAAILGAVVTAAAPILLVPFVLAILVMSGVFLRHAKRLLPILVPALVIHGPALVATWQHRADERWWWLLVREAGPALASPPASSSELLWGVGETPPPWPAATETGNLVLTYLPGVALVAAAAFAVLSGRAAWAARAGWLIAAAGLCVAIVSARTVAVVAGADGTAEANGWPGPGLSLMALGLFVAIAAALGAGARAAKPARLPAAKAGRAGRAPRRPALAPSVGAHSRARRRTLAILGLAILAVHVGAVAWPGREAGGDVRPAPTTVLPLVANLERRSAPETRVLVLWQRDEGAISYEVLSADGWSALSGRAYPTSGEPATGAAPNAAGVWAIAPAVADLAGSGADGAATLRDWGIGVIVVAPDSYPIEAALLRVDDLTLIGASELGASWKVKPAVDPTGDGKVARAWIEEGNMPRLPLISSPHGLSTEVPRSTTSRLVVLATPPDARWWATIDGTPLAAVAGHDRQTFSLGNESGTLEVGRRDRGYRTWWWAGAIIMLWAALGMAPLQDRAYRKERR